MKGEVAGRKLKRLCLRGNPWNNLGFTDLIVQMIFKTKSTIYIAKGHRKQSYKVKMLIFAWGPKNVRNIKYFHVKGNLICCSG